MKPTSKEIQNATQRSLAYVKHRQEALRRYELDEDKKDRIKKGLCKYCYYIDSRFGGCAMTDSNCILCNTVIGNSSTNTDRICKICSDKNGLCRHCGIDMEMKIRKKPYPFEKEMEE